MERTAPCPPELHKAAIQSLFSLVDTIRSHFETTAADLDLTPSQANALLQLDEPGPMSELAEALSCDRSNVTGIVDKLEDRGLVERQTDPADRRVKNIILTSAGVDMRARIQGSLLAAFNTTGLTPAELETLGTLLGRIESTEPA